MSTDTRLRKVCPQCRSLYIRKSKKNNGLYLCTKCGSLFQVPAFKECKTVASMPSGLVKIMKEKKRAKQETVLNDRSFGQKGIFHHYKKYVMDQHYVVPEEYTLQISEIIGFIQTRTELRTVAAKRLNVRISTLRMMITFWNQQHR